jgi:gamma-glutamyltranspeptidase/glutathione hydrolase
MAALAARYGKLPWAQLVSPAETLANQGTPVSRALANDVKLAERKLRADPGVAALFLRADGSLVDEGDNLVQPELGSLLAQIRAKGAAEIHGGLVGQQLANAAQTIGAPLTIEDLRGFLTQFIQPLDVKLGDQTVHLPQPPAAGGLTVAQMLAAMQNGAPDDPTFLADASLRLAFDRAQWLQPGGEVANSAQVIDQGRVAGLMQGQRPSSLSARPENPFSASLVAADRDGLAVACSFTLNALFGSGRLAPGTGVILAPAPDERGFGFSALAPLIVANEYNGELYYASSAGGGVAGAMAEAVMLHRVMVNKERLESAMLRPRIFNDGDPDIAYYDVATSEDPGPALRAAGLAAEEGGILGRVSAIFCPLGSPADPETCQVRADHRGNGLAAVVTKD